MIVTHMQLVCKQILTILSFDTVLKLDPFHKLCFQLIYEIYLDILKV